MEISKSTTLDLETKKIIHDLNERVKELTCLYEISQIYNQSPHDLSVIFNSTVKLLPKAWQYPNSTCARITFEGKEYTTDNFKETEWKQRAPINIKGEIKGTVEVFYLESKPEENEGPFLKEERALINNIADQLARIIQNVRAESKFLQIKQLVGGDQSLSALYTPSEKIKINQEEKEKLLYFLDCIANKERLDLLDYLREKPLSVSELGVLTNKSHSTISHHLKQLEQFAIIIGQKKGKFTYYSLVRDRIGEYINLLQLWFDSAKNFI